MLKTRKKLKKSNEIIYIPTRLIQPNPHQMRTNFNWNEIEGLAQSIQLLGLLEPIIVRQLPKGYELVFGERRLRACKMAGLTTIPAVIAKIGEEKSAFFAAAENIQRKDLNFFEEAIAIENLIKGYRFTREEVAARLGLTLNTLNEKLKILKLPDRIRQSIIENDLTIEHAKELLRLPTVSMMEQVLDAAIDKKLTISETNQLVSEMLCQIQQKCKKGKTVMVFKDVQIFINTLNHAVTTMKESGINAEAKKEETDTFIEYTVRIEKP